MPSDGAAVTVTIPPSPLSVESKSFSDGWTMISTGENVVSSGGSMSIRATTVTPRPVYYWSPVYTAGAD